MFLICSGMKMISRMDCSARPTAHPGRRTGKTLGRLVDENIALVAICKQCKHRKLLSPGHLAAALGRDVEAIAVRTRLRCTRCGCRGPNLHEMTR